MEDKNLNNKSKSGSVIDDPYDALLAAGITSPETDKGIIDLTSVKHDVTNDSDVNINKVEESGEENIDKSKQIKDNEPEDIKENLNEKQDMENKNKKPDKKGFFDGNWKMYLGDNDVEDKNIDDNKTNKDGSGKLDILQVAKEMNVDYDPSQVFDPGTDSHKVYVEFNRRLMEDTFNAIEKRKSMNKEQEKRLQLLSKKINKLVSKYPDMVDESGNVDKKKLVAMSNFIKSLDNSEDGLVVLREFIDYLSVKELGNAVQDKNIYESKDTQKKTGDKNEPKDNLSFKIDQFDDVDKKVNIIIDSKDVERYKRLFG